MARLQHCKGMSSGHGSPVTSNVKVSQGLAVVNLLGCEGMCSGGNCSELRKKEWRWERRLRKVDGGRQRREQDAGGRCQG